MAETGSASVEADASSENDHLVIRIWEVNKNRLESMHKKISERPRLLSDSAGDKSCCIFRVPQSFVNINGESYQPRIVSVGPYHHGKAHVQMIEEHKWRYLGSLLNRIKVTAEGNNLVLEDFLRAVESLQMKARECYSETISLGTDEFVEMLVLDGLFIIELFRKVSRFVSFDPGDPLITMSWVLPFLSRDFLRLENQIPFFILECLFDLSNLTEQESGPTLSTLAFNFFNIFMQRPEEDLDKYKNHRGGHMLDLVRSSFIPSDDQEQLHGNKAGTPTYVIHSIPKLFRAGIKFYAVTAESFLAVKFRPGAIEMPTIVLDDFMTSFLLNCVAYEQCQSDCSKHITSYAAMLDFLVKTPTDVEYLRDQNILVTDMGTDAEVASFLKNMGKDVAFDLDLCYLSGLFRDVNDYYSWSWRVQWASFKNTYFFDFAAVTALILLILTVLQTLFTIYSSFN